MAKDTKKENAEKKEEKIAPQPVSEKIKKAFVDWEKLQTFGILIAMILGFKQKPAPGSSEEGRIPDWILSALPEELTGEDEVWKNITLSSCDNQDILAIELEFSEGAKKAGYDVGKYRTRLMDMKKEFLEQARKGTPKNDPTDRLGFEKTIFRDPCNVFFLQLINEHNAGGTPKEIFSRQEKIGVGRDLLLKMGGLKKTIHWVRINKGKTLALLFAVPFVFFSFIIFFLNLILG